MTRRVSKQRDLTRRDFLVGALGACAAGPQSRVLSGSVTLPAGVSATNATVVSGLGSSAVTGGRFSLTALASFPTLASIVDSVSGNVVLLGMLDPTKSVQTLDAANCAAALIFLALGGSQLTPDGRAPMLATIQSNAAT